MTNQYLERIKDKGPLVFIALSTKNFYKTTEKHT